MKPVYKYLLLALAAYIVYRLFTMDRFTVGDMQITLYVVLGLIVGVTILGFMFSSPNERASMVLSAS